MEATIDKIREELKKNTFANLFCHSVFDGFLVSSGGRVICCNKNLCELFGYEESDLQGKDISIFFGVEGLDKLKDTAEDDECILAGIKKDGDVFDLKVRSKKVVYKNRKMQFFIMRDLIHTEDYKRMVRESEDRYRILTESMLDGILIIDFNGGILFANYMALQMFGFRNFSELTGKSIFEFLVPEYIEKVKSDLNMVYTEQGNYLIEYQVKDRYGSIFWIEAIGKKTVFEGAPVDLVCLRDVTERKLAEESMKNLLGKTKKLLDQTVIALSKTIGEKDPYTLEHQRRVAMLACAVAKQMGFSKESAEGLRIASLLHDIGKIYVPGEILAASRKLTDVETALVRYHPAKGSEILEDVEFPWPVAKIIVQHHERLNGHGYPEGLKEKDILLEARILGVADVVEAMSSHRPYRSALGITAALSEIKKFRGSLYDADVVDACLQVFKEGFNF